MGDAPRPGPGRGPAGHARDLTARPAAPGQVGGCPGAVARGVRGQVGRGPEPDPYLPRSAAGRYGPAARQVRRSGTCRRPGPATARAVRRPGGPDRGPRPARPPLPRATVDGPPPGTPRLHWGRTPTSGVLGHRVARHLLHRPALTSGRRGVPPTRPRRTSRGRPTPGATSGRHPCTRPFPHGGQHGPSRRARPFRRVCQRLRPDPACTLDRAHECLPVRVRLGHARRIGRRRGPRHGTPAVARSRRPPASRSDRTGGSVLAAAARPVDGATGSPRPPGGPPSRPVRDLAATGWEPVALRPQGTGRRPGRRRAPLPAVRRPVPVEHRAAQSPARVHLDAVRLGPGPDRLRVDLSVNAGGRRRHWCPLSASGQDRTPALRDAETNGASTSRRSSAWGYCSRNERTSTVGRPGGHAVAMYLSNQPRTGPGRRWNSR